MTRTRKLTLTMKEFSHLVSESLDVTALPHAHSAPLAPLAQSFVHPIPVLSDNSTHKSKSRPSSFHRIFARPSPQHPHSPVQYEDAMEKQVEDGTETPSRKMIAWPFSRSPRKNRAARDESEDKGRHADSEAIDIVCMPDSQMWSKGHSMDSITSLAAASTSSLGSLLPAHERLFEAMSRDGFFSDETSSNQNRPSVRAGASSPLTFAQPSSPPGSLGRYDTRSRLEDVFGNKSAVSPTVVAVVVADEPQGQTVTEAWCRRRLTQSSGTGTTTSFRDSLSVGETDGSDDDPTPRASTFGSRTKLPSAVMETESRKRPEDVDVSIVTPPSNTNAVVSEFQSPATAWETRSGPRTRTPSLTSSLVKSSSAGVTFPHCPSPSPPRSQTPTVPSDITPPPKIVTVSPAGSPRLRPRSLSRTMTSPPLPRPPPTGPLPAVPSSIPPVPPLPPLLSKKPTLKMSPPLPISSPSRTPSSSPTGMTVATPPSPPGGLRLPSRLSWVNTVRAVLPSPPASPIKAGSKGRSSPSVSPSSEDPGQRKSGDLKRPTSISVIEAADNGHVRRTKSILLLASRSKSHASLGATKRVQIHAEANTESSAPFRKPRRKSSAAAMYAPIHLFSASENALASGSGGGGGGGGGGGAELLVPLERRHSAPLLSSASGSRLNAPQANADWTLSLPFCIDIPGNQIPVASLPLEGQGESEEAPREDWTLCMPLKVRRVTPAIPAIEGCGSECTTADTTETTDVQAQVQVRAQVQTQTQLPTPSPSPTLPSPPTSLCQLEELEEPEATLRPTSPAASLGPHAGGLAMDGGRGKRASGWHVYGWFDEVALEAEDVRVPLQRHRNNKGNHHNAASRRTTTHELNMSQDSTFSVSTNGGTVYHSARSSLLVN